jgi:hypothetical protein
MSCSTTTRPNDDLAATAAAQRRKRSPAPFAGTRRRTTLCGTVPGAPRRSRSTGPGCGARTSTFLLGEIRVWKTAGLLPRSSPTNWPSDYAARRAALDAPPTGHGPGRERAGYRRPGPGRLCSRRRTYEGAGPCRAAKHAPPCRSRCQARCGRPARSRPFFRPTISPHCTWSGR